MRRHAMTIIPTGYESQLSLYDTQRAIERIKHVFLTKLCAALHLVRVTAPLVVDPTMGINDNLNGVERPVRPSNTWPSGSIFS